MMARRSTLFMIAVSVGLFATRSAQAQSLTEKQQEGAGYIIASYADAMAMAAVCQLAVAGKNAPDQRFVTAAKKYVVANNFTLKAVIRSLQNSYSNDERFRTYDWDAVVKHLVNKKIHSYSTDLDGKARREFCSTKGERFIASHYLTNCCRKQLSEIFGDWERWF